MKIFFLCFLLDINMEQKVLIFGKQCNNKNVFCKHKHLIDINKDIDKIVISCKDSYDKTGSLRCFIGYISNYIKPLCIKVPQMNGYVKYFNGNKCMNLLVLDKELLKNNAVLDKISNLSKKGLITIVYNNKYIKTKLKIYNNRINTNFHSSIKPEDNEYCTCYNNDIIRFCC